MQTNIVNPFDSGVDDFRELIDEKVKNEPKSVPNKVIDAELEEYGGFNSVNTEESTAIDENGVEVAVEEVIDEPLHGVAAESQYCDEGRSVGSFTDNDPTSITSLLKPKDFKRANELANEYSTSEQKALVKKTFSNLYQDLNERYGLNLQMDADSFSDMMRSFSDPKTSSALTLYTSIAFDRFRSLLYNKFLNSIALLSEKILDPEYILSDSVSYDDKLKLMKELFGFMTQVETIYSTIKIDSAELKLDHISDDQVGGADLNDPATRELLNKLLNKE